MLLVRPDRDSDRVRLSEGGERTDENALLEHPLEELRRILAQVDIDEVADGTGDGLEAVAAQDLRQLGHAVNVEKTPAVELVGVVEARERRNLRGGRDVERAPHLRHRSADVERADGVADAEACEAVDLRERA